MKIYINSKEFKHIGAIHIATFEDKVVFLTLEKSKIYEYFKNDKVSLIEDPSSCVHPLQELAGYLDGKINAFTCETKFLKGTEFQKRVWNELKTIPYGQTISYAQLASRIGNDKACRAVGTANSKNPVPIIVPCHRVINANGNLGGFALGIGVKKYLLDLEKSF